MLSDGHIQRRSLTSNARFIFSQSGKENKRPYFELVYNMFKVYCVKDSKYYEKTWEDKKTNQKYTSITFTTMQLPCFTGLHSLWYSKKKKVVPKNIKEGILINTFGFSTLNNGWRFSLKFGSSFKCLCIFA